MRYRSSQGKKRFTWVCVLLAMATQCTVVVAQSLADQRSDYAEAVQAIDRGQWTSCETLRPALDDYPLAIYLDYFQLTRARARAYRHLVPRAQRRYATTEPFPGDIPA